MKHPTTKRPFLFHAALAATLAAGSVSASAQNSAPQPLRAQEFLLRAQTRNLRPDERLSLNLAAAKYAFPGMLAGNPLDSKTYASALDHIVSALAARRFENRKVSGTGGSFEITVARSGKNAIDPAGANTLAPASEIRLDGLDRRWTEAGAGVPFTLCYFQGSPSLANQPGVSRAGISVPATAILQFEGNRASLTFFDRLNTSRLKIEGRDYPLAADFSAPIAQTLSRTPNRPFDVPGLVFTRQYLRWAGLFQFQLYDRDRIPVILVHGLFSRPEAWIQVLNDLMGNAEIRKRYQFWFFQYPTGLPVWQSSKLLRSELDRYHTRLEQDGKHPNLHRIVLAGHSMGGLISSLLMRDPGTSFWSSLSDRSLDELEIGPESRELVREMLKFAPRQDISRVIFITTPHRGSPIPHNPIISRAIRFIQMPRTFSRGDRAELVGAIRKDLRGLFEFPANSIRFLKSGSPVLEAIETLPFARRIPYHSIIGDRGRGDTPDSTDGIVPYWSSHMDGADSEKIIPTDHSAPRYPETSDEIRRILLKHARK